MLTTSIQPQPLHPQGSAGSLGRVAAPLVLVRSTNSTRPKLLALPPKACQSPRGGYYLSCAHEAVVWKPKRCRRCEPCRNAKQGKVVARALNAMGSAKWVVLVTVTTKPVAGSWPEWSQIMAWWSRTVAWVRRTVGPVEYMAVKEEGTQHGMRHLHIVMTGVRWLERTALRAWWRRLSGAYNVDVRRVWGRDGVAAYLAKYLAKAPLPLRKSVTYSAGFPKLTSLAFAIEAVWPPAPRPERWVNQLVDGGLVQWWGSGGKCSCFGEIHLLE